MADRFPTFDLPRGQSPNLAIPDRSPAGAGALGELGADADRLGSQLQDMATEAAKQQGAQQAAADVQAGTVTPRNDLTIKGQAYDQVAKNYLGSQRQAALAVGMQTAYEANPQSPQALGPALDAVIQGYKAQPTGYADLDAELDGHYLVRRADFMARAIAGARAASVAQDKANFETEVSSGADLLDQAAAGASADAGGGQRITDAAGLFVRGLAKYGPKEAFDVGAQHFDADPNRRGTIAPDDMARISTAALTKARETWILGTALTLPDEASRKMYARQVYDKWKAGDPSFAGIDGPDMDRLQDKLHASADRARADDRASKTEFEQKAREGIESFTWGADPDFDEVLTNARLSGNAALVAQAEFYKNADVHTRGVLRTVVQRQLGLLQNGGPQDVVVDANGAPIAPAPAAGVAGERGARNNNPGNVKALPHGELWPGQTGVDPDGYAVFGTAQAGAEAAKANLRSYARQGLVTVQDIINRWAPAADHNNPQAYAATVARQLHVQPGDKLNMADPHVVDHLAAAMFGVETPGGPWAVPPGVQPGSPAYVAWASAQDGFASDPLKYARGGVNRPAIANVPILVPNGAFMDGAPAQAWGQALQKRYTLGQGLAQAYGVPPRMLDGGEVDFYKAQIAADPRAGIKLAQAATQAIGPAGAQSLLRELGQSGPTASVNLHLADLQAMGAGSIANRALQGLDLQREGRTLKDPDKHALDAAFDQIKGAVPPTVYTAAYATAHAAMIADFTTGAIGDPAKYRDGALGGTSWQGRFYGGSADVNDARTVLPAWLNPDRAGDALRALGQHWAQTGKGGPVWSNGQTVTGEQLAHMQLALQPSGLYRFVNPRTGNPLMRPGGGAYEWNADQARGYLAQALGVTAVRPQIVSR